VKKIFIMSFIISFFLVPFTVRAEISPEEQKKAAQRAYEASASAYNEVAAAPKKAKAQVKKAVSQVQSTGKGATQAVRG